jgi:hypothetical protein
MNEYDYEVKYVICRHCHGNVRMDSRPAWYSGQSRCAYCDGSGYTPIHVSYGKNGSVTITPARPPDCRKGPIMRVS